METTTNQITKIEHDYLNLMCECAECLARDESYKESGRKHNDSAECDLASYTAATMEAR
jgi:hypothetical protein